MSSDLFQSDYEQLETLAGQFGQQAEAQESMLARVKSAADNLADGGWIGEGSEAFQQEMEGVMIPACSRLINALKESQRVTRDIVRIIQQAEDEASAPFRGGGGGGFPGGGGRPGGGIGIPGMPGGGGRPGSLPGGGGLPGGGASGGGGSIWDNLRSKGPSFGFDFGKGDDGSRRGGKFSPGFDLTIGTKERSVWGDPSQDGWAGVGGHVEAGAKFNLDDGVFVGAGGEYYTVKGKADTAFVGDKEWGITGGVEGKALSAGGFAGVQWDGNDKRIGAEVGVNLVSVEGSVGGNIAGTNVSVAGEIGLKAELGFSLGKKGVEVKLPFISFGLKFGGGVD